MDSRVLLRLTAALFLACAACGSPRAQAPVDAGGVADPSTGLKWKPHRAAQNAAAPAPAAPDTGLTASPRPAGDAIPAPAPPPVQAPAAMPGPAAATGIASVTLPPDVPRVTGAPAPGRGPSTPNRVPGPLQRTPGPNDPFAFLPQDLTRAPQGEVGRPLLEPEGRQAASLQRRAERLAPGRGDAGPASRPTAARGRNDRLAMNVDAMPSVLSRAPQAAVLQGEAPRPGAAAGEGPEILAPPAAPRMASPQVPPPATAPGGVGLDGSSALESSGVGDMGFVEGDPTAAPGTEGMLFGQYPSQLHVESFYDDPYECEDECESPLHQHYGRVCGWLRQFGKPYYGWRWYRDFTASAGLMSFTNPTDLGINGNYGTNEAVNWAMPLWNAFGIGWQVGARATQSNFQSTSVSTPGGTLQKNSRNQVFVTTGFFTRAFEGRGLQGGAVFDYLSDSWFDNTDLTQIRGEISYVWGYHEFGFWSATNVGNQIGLYSPVTGQNGLATSVDQYCGFYRLQFGDANEWKVWGGGTGYGGGVVGSLVRAPMSRAFALEGTFTYLIPGKSVKFDADGQGSTYTFSPSAWNVGVNLVYYPAGRSRKSLASPYRPLFDVADNGSLIHTIRGLK